MTKPWGGIDPNSQHQFWSHWTFKVYEGGRPVPKELVSTNVAKWLRLGFGSVGQVKVEQAVFVIKGTNGPRPARMSGYRIEARVEGVPAHDPGYVASVRRGFEDFVQKGWGPYGSGELSVRVLAGDQQDGKPRTQVIVGSMIVPKDQAT